MLKWNCCRSLMVAGAAAWSVLGTLTSQEAAAQSRRDRSPAAPYQTYPTQTVPAQSAFQPSYPSQAYYPDNGNPNTGYPAAGYSGRTSYPTSVSDTRTNAYPVSSRTGYGNRASLDRLATDLSSQANSVCNLMHASYQNQQNFRELYREMYDVLEETRALRQQIASNPTPGRGRDNDRRFDDVRSNDRRPADRRDFENRDFNDRDFDQANPDRRDRDNRNNDRRDDFRQDDFRRDEPRRDDSRRTDDRIEVSLHNIDRQFHQIEQDLRGWDGRPNTRDYRGGGRETAQLVQALDQFGDTLHAMMDDYGVTSRLDGGRRLDTRRDFDQRGFDDDRSPARSRDNIAPVQYRP